MRLLLSVLTRYTDLYASEKLGLQPGDEVWLAQRPRIPAVSLLYSDSCSGVRLTRGT